MNTLPRKTLSLAGKSGKTVYKPALTGVSNEGYHMDEWTADNQRMNQQRSAYQRMDDRGTRHGGRYQEHGARHQEDPGVNKIRRGPGRRLAKEKRLRSMDPALMQKYATLSPALQEKVNATIEIYYQQQMAKTYKGEVSESEPEDDYFQEEDVIYDADQTFQP